jgi:hypothetical protein
MDPLHFCQFLMHVHRSLAEAVRWLDLRLGSSFVRSVDYQRQNLQHSVDTRDRLC